MKPKTVAIICTSAGFGGLEMNTINLARLLAQQGWQVRLLLNERSQMTAICRQHQLSVTTVQSSRFPGGDLSVVKRWMQQYPASILFTPYNKDIITLALYKLLINRQARLVYQQHMKVGVSKRDPFHTLLYRQLDLWISPLEYLREEVLRRTRVRPAHIRVVPIGLEARKFGIPLNQEAARLQLDLPQHAFIIGVLGRIDPKKGQDFLIRSMPAVLRQIHSAHLVIGGNVTPHEGSTYLEHLRTLVRTLNLQQRVHFVTHRQEVVPFYKAIDVFAMPSSGETYGMVTLEAMAAGTPVLGVNRDGTKELLLQGRLGWLYEPEDITGFCRQLVAIADGTEVSRRTASARSEVLQRYTIPGMVQALDDCLQALL